MSRKTRVDADTYETFKRVVLETLDFCEDCGIAAGVTAQPPRAMNDTRSHLLCPGCTVDYHAFWDDLFADYYNGSGVSHVTPRMLKQAREAKR